MPCEKPPPQSLRRGRAEGVYLDRTEASLKPRFVKGEPPSDADVAAVRQQIRQRIIRTLRRLGYLEAGSDAAMATGYAPCLTASLNSPALWRPPSHSALPLGSGPDRKFGA
jgi:hypothetical protein